MMKFLCLSCVCLILTCAFPLAHNQTNGSPSLVSDLSLVNRSNKEHFILSRNKRDYDDSLYDWDYDGNYKDYKEEEPNKHIEKLKYYADNWHVIAKRSLKLATMVLTVAILGCCFCQKCCSVLCTVMCFNCKELWGRICCQDPMYLRAKVFCQQAGMNLDYATYKKIKSRGAQAAVEQGIDTRFMGL